MSRTILLFLLLSLGHISAVYADELGNANQRLFLAQLELAKNGNTNGQYYVGEMYENGLGVQQDLNKAFEWYEKAAEKKHPLSLRKLKQRLEIEAEYASGSDPFAQANQVTEEQKLVSERMRRKKARARALLRKQLANPQEDPFE